MKRRFFPRSGSLALAPGLFSAFRDYLTALLEFVSGELAKGRHQDDILAAPEIPGTPEWTGDGIQRSLTAALTELSESGITD